MPTHWLLDRLKTFDETPALIGQGGTRSYRTICEDSHDWIERLREAGIGPGDVVAMIGDYSSKACAFLLAAIASKVIVVPLAPASAGQHDDFLTLTEAAAVIRIGDDGETDVTRLPGRVSHPLLHEMAARGSTGLILFSSGSTGPSKAALLDFDRLLIKFHTQRPAVRTFAFLQLDHIGGINTLSHVFCSGGAIVTAAERSVDSVCAAIERYRVQLLPTTPTFLRMMMIADATARYDLSSLETITYGTEPMPESTLAAARRALPQARFKQTYGLSELGILPTRSESSDSLWLKLGTAGFDARIVDGVLWLKSQSAMLGYLNAPSPFDADGWFNTQDQVDVRGEYIRILGRRSEFINVGGDKVHPAEVESVLLTLDNIVDVTVFGRRNPVTGEIVCARVTLAQPEETQGLRQRLRVHCRGRLQPYKIPAVVEVAESAQHSYRFKKLRDGAAGA